MSMILAADDLDDVDRTRGARVRPRGDLEGSARWDAGRRVALTAALEAALRDAECLVAATMGAMYALERCAVDDDGRLIGADGRGLAGVIATLRQEHRELFGLTTT